jgi:hypothetical protein
MKIPTQRNKKETFNENSKKRFNKDFIQKLKFTKNT